MTGTSNRSKLKENVTHGDVLFPFQQYFACFDRFHPHLYLHWHPELELTKIHSGGGVYSIDFQDYDVKTNDFVLIQPDLLHSAKTRLAKGFSSESFVFHLNLLGISSADTCSIKYLLPIKEKKILLPKVIKPDHACYKQLDSIFQQLSICCNRKNVGHEFEIKGLLFQFIYLLISGDLIEKSQDTPFQSERIKLIFQFIHTHFSEEIDVKTISNLCGITPSHFMHFFKKTTGITLTKYINNYRLAQAGDLLKNSRDIADTAYACGFNSLSYFYKRFHEYYHMTPRQYLERC